MKGNAPFRVAPETIGWIDRAPPLREHMTENGYAVRLRGVTKRFGKHTAVSSLDFAQLRV